MFGYHACIHELHVGYCFNWLVSSASYVIQTFRNMHEMVDKRAKQNVGSCQLSTSKIDESNYDIVSAGSKIATIRMFIQHKLGLAKPVL